MTKTVLITGCSSGLGRSAALAFAAQGWNVAATVRRPDDIPPDTFPDGVLVRALDVADPASATAGVEACVECFGGLDVVVNNAGVSTLSIFETTPPHAIQRIFDTNVFGTMNVTRAAIPHLRERSGSIVSVTSGVGIVAVPLLCFYVASKHALEGFFESVSYELESQGIRVKLIEPGAIRTTQFSANTVATTSEMSIPDSYKAYFDHALTSMRSYPFADTDEQAVVEAILSAATDRSDRLRYTVGPDVEEYSRLRWSTSEATYQTEMGRLVGQAAWHDR
jgi:NAD(P)-dependent dehydrogenase (short-subunit alcohol dehydrogenase family)